MTHSVLKEVFPEASLPTLCFCFNVNVISNTKFRSVSLHQGLLFMFLRPHIFLVMDQYVNYPVQQDTQYKMYVLFLFICVCV